MKLNLELENLLKPTIEELGLTFVGLEILKGGNRAVMRVYIDKSGGVSLEDCQWASEHVSAVLDINDSIASAYELEVSSPGVDRKFFSAAQMSDYLGAKISVRLKSSIDGQRKFTGSISGIVGDNVELCVSGEKTIGFSFSNVEQAKLVPEWVL